MFINPSALIIYPISAIMEVLRGKKDSIYEETRRQAIAGDPVASLAALTTKLLAGDRGVIVATPFGRDGGRGGVMRRLGHDLYLGKEIGIC